MHAVAGRRWLVPDPLHRIIAAIDARRFLFSSERELQDAIGEVLVPFGAEREARIPYAGRIDFRIDRLGVEIKVDGSLPKVAGQVLRYVKSGALDQLLLVTTKRAHAEVAGERLGAVVRVLVLDGGIC